MTQEQLVQMVAHRFTPHMQVLIPDGLGGFRRASVHAVVWGIFDNTPGYRLMVWPADAPCSATYELSFVLEHIQSVA